MILTCPECTTRYRFDDERVPEAGLSVRCKRCRAVFRAQRPVPSPAHASGAREPVHAWKEDASAVPAAKSAGPAPVSQTRATPVRSPDPPAAARGSMRAEPAPVAPFAGSTGRPRRGGTAPAVTAATAPSAAGSRSSTATAIPVTIVPGTPPPGDEEIRRLTRIILSDIVIYSPERAEGAIRDGRFPELYRSEIEEGRKMIRSRFASAPAAVETYDRALRELLETRRKELQESAGAL